MPRIMTPEWRDQNENTQYPFSAKATLTNGTVVVPEILFLDAAVRPIGGGQAFLSRVAVTFDSATLYFGDDQDRERCSCVAEFDVGSSPGETLLALADKFGRPAGVLVSETTRLTLLQAWGVGDHLFDRAQTELCPAACHPVPESGVGGILLDDGTLLTGDVWLVGGPGVNLSIEALATPAGCSPEAASGVRVDVVGDPLHLRRLCSPDPPSAFQEKKFLRRLVFVDASGNSVSCSPETGGVSVFSNNDLAPDTVIRVASGGAGLTFSAVGSKLGGTL